MEATTKTVTLHKIPFDDYLIMRDEDLEGSAMLLAKILGCDMNVDFNLRLARTILESVESVMDDYGYGYCDPYYVTEDEAEIPCYKSNECVCNHKECPYKTGHYIDATEDNENGSE